MRNGNPMLSVENLHAAIGEKPILRGVDLAVRAGEVHAVMGPNGSGKSTLANVIAGREEYRVTAGSVRYQGVDLLAMPPEERAKEGIFLAFQNPVEIPGVSNLHFMKAALNAVRKHRGLQELDVVEFRDTVLERLRRVEMGEDLLQIRGLGIINVRALYGESATVPSCPVGLVVELEEWKQGHHYSLIGLRERRYRILGVNVPYLKLPVKPGRNMATLIEVAARNQMLKNRGIFTARELGRALKKRLAG